jgi:ribonuclease VapC
VFEAVAAICRKRWVGVADARADVRDFPEITRVNTVALTAADGDTALQAFDRYGKGRSHPAQLNLADCFAYAVAKNRGVPLLFRGDDFDKTDITDGR